MGVSGDGGAGRVMTAAGMAGMGQLLISTAVILRGAGRVMTAAGMPGLAGMGQLPISTAVILSVGTESEDRGHRRGIAPAGIAPMGQSKMSRICKAKGRNGRMSGGTTGTNVCVRECLMAQGQQS